MPYKFFTNDYPCVIEPVFENDLDGEPLIVAFDLWDTSGKYIGQVLPIDFDEGLIAWVYQQVKLTEDFFRMLRDIAHKRDGSS